MKKKLTLLFALLCVSVMGFAIDWSGIGWVADGLQAGALKETYKVSPSSENASYPAVVNIQNAGSAEKTGIYVTFPNGIVSCSLTSYGVQGGGLWMSLSNFSNQETPVEVTTDASITYHFAVYYENGTPGGSCTDETAPTVTAVEKSDITYNSIVLTVTASDNDGGTGIASYIVKNGDTQIATSATSPITVTGLTAGTTYNNIKVITKDGCDNESSAYSVEAFETLSRASECEGDLGHFGTWDIKRVHYKIEYLPSTNKIRYEVRGFGTQVLDFCQIQTTVGNSPNLSIIDGVAVWKQDAPAAGTEMGILFLFSTDAFGGNEMNAENTSSFVGNNAHLVYYKSRDCGIAVEPATAPTTTPDESTIFNDCQIYSILGSDYYMSAGFNNEKNAWGGGDAATETIDGRDVFHIWGSNYLERGFNAHDVSGYTHIHFDVWTAEAMNLGMKLMAYDGDWKEGDKQSFTTNAGSWKSVDLALSGFNHGYLNKIQGIYPLDLQREDDVYFTNIYFYKTTEDVTCYETLNLAEGKPSEGGFIPGNEGEVPAKANDGAENTLWVTWADRPASEEWWYVDLKNNYNINKIEVVWGADYSSEYILQTRTEAPSNADKADDAAWVTIATVTDAAANTTKTNTFTTASGRYVRFHSLSRPSNCIRLAELRVFGNGYAITDVNNPVITTAEVADDSENETSVKLHLVATDEEDGAVKTFLLNKGDDTWLPIATDASNTYTVSELARGHYSYQVKARDHAGNVSEASTISFDIFNPAENLALNKPVVAGYTPQNKDEVPAKANDGNLSTPWTTYNDRPMDEQWWSVDLGEVYQLSGVDLFWDVRSNHYLIQVAQTEPSDRTDDTQWFTALDVNETQKTGNTEENKNHYALNVPARYVRFKAITKDGTFLKLWEFRVFGSAYAVKDNNAPEITSASVTYGEGNAYLTLQATDTEDGIIKTFRVVNTTTGDKAVYTTDGENKIAIAGLDINTPYDFEIQAIDKAANLSVVTPLTVRIPATEGNIALGKPVVAGFETDGPGEAKEKANDGELSTFWATWNTGDVTREWIYVDLESLYDLKKVVVTFEAGLVSGDYILQYRSETPTPEQAADDAAWTDIAEVTTASGSNLRVETEASGVARYVRFRTKTANVRLAELEVYASAAVIELNEAMDNTATIAANDANVVNAIVTRSFAAGNLYTLVLPFAVDAAQTATKLPGHLTKLQNTIVKENQDLRINFVDVSEIEAGVPYLYEPSAAVANPTFESVEVSATLNPTVADSYAKYYGIYAPMDGVALHDIANAYVLGPDQYLYAVSDLPANQTMLALRGYFVLNFPSTAGAAPRRVAQVVFNSQETEVATGIENAIDNEQNAKILRDGQLLIIREGKMYNAQGQLIK